MITKFLGEVVGKYGYLDSYGQLKEVTYGAGTGKFNIFKNKCISMDVKSRQLPGPSDRDPFLWRDSAIRFQRPNTKSRQGPCPIVRVTYSSFPLYSFTLILLAMGLL